MAMYSAQTNGLGADMTDGTGTINPAALNSSGISGPPSSEISPRGVKRSHTPDTYGDLATGDGTDDGGSKPRKRGRPMKPRSSGGVSESPTQSSMPHPGQVNLPPQTPQSQSVGLPSQQSAATPTQASPPKTTPKSVLKALPTVRDHTTDQLGPEGDEYIPREIDEAGEKKVDANGQLSGNREYRCRTFYVPHRGEKLFMLATECARVLGYRDSYLLFNKNRSLYKIIATQTEKEDLIHQEILPFSYRSRQIAIVTAKSMFRQFGSRVIVSGRRVRDDYWETKARKQGFTEDDLAGEKRPGAAKARDAAAAEASANASAILGHHGDIVYSNAPVHFGGHPQPQTVQPGMLGAPGVATPLPMITLGPEQNDMRIGDYRNVPRPRHEISGPAYQDRTQSSAQTEHLVQAHQAAEFNKQVTQQRNMRGKYIDGIWRQPHEPPPPSTAAPAAAAVGDALPAVTQSMQSPHSNPSNLQQPMMSQSGQQHAVPGQSYSQSSHQQNPLVQSPMRSMAQTAIRPDQMRGRSPSLSLGSSGMAQSANPYAFPPHNQMWPPPQPQASPQHFPNYGQNSPHLQQSPHQPPQLRQSTSNSQMQSSMQYSGMQGMPQNYPGTSGRGIYQPDPSSQQYMPQQNTPGQQPSAQGWAGQQNQPGPGAWGWGNQG
ncbi:MAG: hypothetical protein M1818_005852 [Claussenomyces sp. TS43310]|nr:MAG: hypothetical protein M1818_005852 [Claussenomyces sp. TS43310]